MRKVTATIIGLVIVGLLAGGAQAESTLDQVKKKGVLVAGVKYRVPPFGFLDQSTGQLIGYDVDVVQALADKLGVRLELRPVDQKTRIPSLLSGNVDIVAANLTANPDIGKVIDFSDVYLSTGVGFIAKTGTVKGLQDLLGKKIAVGEGTVAEQVVKTDVANSTVVPFDDYQKGLAALESGEVDAGAGDVSLLPVLLPMLASGRYEVLPFQIAEIPYVLGVRQGDKAFLDFVNETVQAMKQAGELEKLHAKWFRPADPATGEKRVASAAGVISRKAAVRPRFVAVILRGEFDQDAEVSVFSTSGEFVCTGTVASVFDDQIYVDVDPAKYEFVKPGFAVGMDVNQSAAKDAILKHQDVLKSVQAESKEEADALAAQREAEGIADEQRRKEADAAAYQNDLRIKAERIRDRDNNNYYYGGGYYRGSYRGRYYR